MKRRKIIISILLILLISSIGISAYTIVMEDSIYEIRPENLTIIETPEQKEAQTPPQFETPQPIIPEKPEGTNIALGKPVEANGHTDIYVARNATDGKITTYWEGKANSYPNILTVDLEEVSTVTSIRIALNPDKIWSKRTQTFSINYSLDGNVFNELIPSSNYIFDPLTGNIVDIKLDTPTKMRFIQLVFTANTEATGGQAAEIEVYSSD